jgi:hypothetical protein
MRSMPAAKEPIHTLELHERFLDPWCSGEKVDIRQGHEPGKDYR